MATHAHSTRTPLLRPADSQGLSRFAQTEQNARSLLGAAPGRQSGPVTIAIAAMRAADPDLDRQRLRDLRRRIADRIKADLVLLDALDGDADLEATALERAGRGFRASGHDDAEDSHDAEANTDDNGIADWDAAAEQGFPGYGRCA
jgi:hypothetical protein